MSYSNLFVAKLPRNLNDADLEQIFAEYFPISAKVMLDAATGKSKGFGFVLFNTEEEGRKAYEGMNRKSTRACNHNFTLVIYPSQHSGKAAASASNALYIRNIPVSVPQHQVEQFLASFGTLLYCAMREDHYGSPVWVVYAEYDCLDCSANALRKLHGNSQHFGNPPVMVKYADSEEAKRERRRRREEGKSAPAPAPRSACVFPPPRRPQDACHAALGSSGSSNSAAGCSRESTNCSIGPTPNSDAASSVSSAYKVLDAVFTASPPPPPPPQMLFAAAPPQLPPMYPMEFSYHPQPLAPPVIHPGHLSGCSTESMPPVVIVLENGQQLLLAPNAVNVRPSDFAASAGNTLFWPSMDGMYPPMSPSQLPPSYAAVPFP
ncbi:RNA-binding protein [Trypanosoma theileri]|uniref:RNA-binding protein n=1 Tax=Trypanosoma theileri TaxID=67003 RepID=A0A1X0P1N1_9TRYP|nr:RNA-binding protein [Trypanosoma theileri]ORC90856.1 RNA-binding protein [Trypanosoma theileri]